MKTRISLFILLGLLPAAGSACHEHEKHIQR